MDEPTVDYLIAVTAMRFEQYEVAGKMIAGIMQSATNPRMKDKTRDLKEMLILSLDLACLTMAFASVSL